MKKRVTARFAPIEPAPAPNPSPKGLDSGVEVVASADVAFVGELGTVRSERIVGKSEGLRVPGRGAAETLPMQARRAADTANSPRMVNDCDV